MSTHARPQVRNLAKGPPRVAVVGAGIIGLTTALELTRSGAQVVVFAGRARRGIASAVAAASWYPYAVSGFRPEWAAATFRVFTRHAAESPASGARRQAAREYIDAPSAKAAAAYVDALWWRDLDATNLRVAALSDDERTFDFGPDDPLGRRTFPAAIDFTTVVVPMDKYLPFVEGLCRDAGIEIVADQWIADLRRFGHDERFDAVVNCGGFAAEMFADSSRRGQVRPVAGQVLRVAAPRVDRLTVIHSGAFHEAPLYVVPRGPFPDGSPGEVVLGGSYVPLAAAGPQQEPPVEDPSLTARIICRCRTVEPRLGEVRIMEARVGLRPVSQTVQVGADPLNSERPGDVPVFNNYGHGGGGVSLSWGCAEATAAAVFAAFGRVASS